MIHSSVEVSPSTELNRQIVSTISTTTHSFYNSIMLIGICFVFFLQMSKKTSFLWLTRCFFDFITMPLVPSNIVVCHRMVNCSSIALMSWPKFHTPSFFCILLSRQIVLARVSFFHLMVCVLRGCHLRRMHKIRVPSMTW